MVPTMAALKLSIFSVGIRYSRCARPPASPMPYGIFVVAIVCGPRDIENWLD
jgi:hypothetical protein